MGNIKKVGDQNIDATFLLLSERKKEETWVDSQPRISIMARKMWVKMKITFFVRKSCRKYVARHGVGL